MRSESEAHKQARIRRLKCLSLHASVSSCLFHAPHSSPSHLSCPFCRDPLGITSLDQLPIAEALLAELKAAEVTTKQAPPPLNEFCSCVPCGQGQCAMSLGHDTGGCDVMDLLELCLTLFVCSLPSLPFPLPSQSRPSTVIPVKRISVPLIRIRRTVPAAAARIRSCRSRRRRSTSWIPSCPRVLLIRVSRLNITVNRVMSSSVSTVG